MRKKVIVCICALFLISCNNNDSKLTTSESTMISLSDRDSVVQSNEELSSTVTETESSNEESGWLPDIRP